MDRISPPDLPRRLGGLDTICSFATAAIIAVASTVLISCAADAFGATFVNQGGGTYFSGPGRSPSYGPAAIANGFGPGRSNRSSQQASGSGGQTCGCGQGGAKGDNPGHH